MSRLLLAIAVLVAAATLVLIALAEAAHADTQVVGDSLTAQTYESGGWIVDAQIGRALRSSLPLVTSKVTTAPAALVVALGSNDVNQRSVTMASDLAAVAGLPVPCVVVTTVKVDGVTPFYGNRWVVLARRWNRLVERSGATVADWNSYSSGRPRWFLADGLHLTTAGERAYDRLLRSTVADCTAV